MECACVESAKLVKMRWSILNMGHDIMSSRWRSKARLGYEGPCARVKGKLEAQDAINHRGGEV